MRRPFVIVECGGGARPKSRKMQYTKKKEEKTMYQGLKTRVCILNPFSSQLGITMMVVVIVRIVCLIISK